MSAFKDMFAQAGMANSESKKVQAQSSNSNGSPKGIFSDMFNSVFGKKEPPTATHPRQRAGDRNQSMVSSPYGEYGKKLFAKEGGMRYDLFTGEKAPSQPLDRLTIGQLKDLQRKRKNSAAGAYQFTLATVEDLQKEMGLKDSDTFSAATQNRMFETFTRGNEGHARKRLGKTRLSDAERYSMHFLGRYGGVDFLGKLRDNPNALFAKEFPKAYANNKALFAKVGGANATLADAFYELSNRMK